VSRPYLRYGDRGRLHNLSPPSVLFESSQIFFYNSNSVIFEIFFEIFKRCRVVPLQPIWTIMVAAKLDQSSVLVTNFRQNG